MFLFITKTNQKEDMKLQEQCTTVEQSKRLLELEVNKDTASLKWWLVSQLDSSNEDYISSNTVGLDIIPNIPCWTIADMMSIIHNDMKDVYFKETERYEWAGLEISDNCFVSIRNKETCDCDDIDFYEKELLRDNLFDCLVWLTENKYL